MGRKKILVIDDDPDILEAIKLTLENEGFEVSISKSTQRLNRRDLPDLILLDVLLSGYDGRELAKKFKSNTSTKRIPIILFSADTSTKKKYKDSGADDFLAKPFDINLLIKKVRKLI